MERGKTSTVTKIEVNQGQVPAGTKNVSMILEDLDFLNAPHGTHFYNYENSDIVLENEFKIFPLTPPSDQSHHYRLTVRAFDSEHRFIGVGTVISKFP